MNDLHYVSGVLVEVTRNYGTEHPTFITDGEVIRRAGALRNLPKKDAEHADKSVG